MHQTQDLFLVLKKLFLAALCAGYSLIAVRELLIAVVSLVEHRFLALRLPYLQHVGSVIVSRGL